jgi:hypothetical protein
VGYVTVPLTTSLAEHWGRLGIYTRALTTSQEVVFLVAPRSPTPQLCLS